MGSGEADGAAAEEVVEGEEETIRPIRRRLIQEQESRHRGRKDGGLDFGPVLRVERRRGIWLGVEGIGSRRTGGLVGGLEGIGSRSLEGEGGWGVVVMVIIMGDLVGRVLGVRQVQVLGMRVRDLDRRLGDRWCICI
jgi:hypothetical protein